MNGTIPSLRACPTCSGQPTINRDTAFSIACDECYDGAIDSGPQPHGSAITEAAAIESWNDQVEDFQDSQLPIGSKT